jgi:DNA-directed RNA polymerase subunit RPC12/RpoP
MPPPPLPGKSPPPSPEVESKAPPAGRKFPCRQCGAKLDFDPAARGLKCPYCGFTEHIPEADDDQKAAVREHDLEEFLATQEERASVAVAGHRCQVRCGGCGAVIVLEDRVATDKCPYCGTHLENKPEAVKDLIPPESLLPFTVTDRDARDRFNTWITGLWFAPTELKQLANLGQFGSVYAPFWTYDAMTYTSYTGQRGDDYWEEESYTDAQGKRQTRQVRKTRWHSVSGEVRHFFDDVLVRASETLPAPLMDRLPPWHLKELEPFREEFLSGHLAERYAVSLAEGFRVARGVMEDEITGLICRDIGGDHQRIDQRRTNYLGVTFKHTLLPIWVANYRYRDKLFHILVNGRTGKVAGERPWSWWKIARLVVLIIFAILLTLILVNKAKGRTGGRAATAGPAELARMVESPESAGMRRASNSWSGERGTFEGGARPVGPGRLCRPAA